MELLKLLRKASLTKTVFILLMSLIAGIAGGLVVPLVLTTAEQVAAGQYHPRAILSLLALAVLLILPKRVAQTQTARLTEQALAQLITRIANIIRHTELAEFEKLNRADVYVTIHECADDRDGRCQND